MRYLAGQLVMLENNICIGGNNKHGGKNHRSVRNDSEIYIDLFYGCGKMIINVKKHVFVM